MASPVSTDSFLQWDPAQVSNFIASSIDKNIGPLFLNNNLDGLLLPYITTDHLRELGIEKLSVRLQVKKCIADLVYQHCQLSSSTDNSKGNINADSGTNNNSKAVEHVQPYASINNNFLHVESLSLALSLLRETFSKMSAEQQQVQQYQLQQQQLIQQQQLQQIQQIQQQQLELSNPPSPSQQQLDLKKLNENFNKLKSDLIPAIRLIKESKPLPTPTLDPGSTTLHALESPTFSILSSNIFNESNNSGNNTSSNLTNSTTISNGPNSNGSSNANGGEKLANTRRNSLTSTVVAAGSAIAAAVNFSGSLSNSNSIANINNNNNNSNNTNNNNSNNNSNNNNGSASNVSANNSGSGGASNSSSQHTLSNSNSNSSLSGNGGARISAYPPSSPTLASNRYSSGSILSMGTGKVILQSVVSSDQPTVARNSNFTLQKITNRINTNSGNNARPRLVETRSANNMLTKPSSRPHNSQLVSANALMTNSSSGSNAINGNGNTSPSNGNGASTAAASTEPLKQLRASSDDSCLKILQQAMKRHHIPRDDWSKYVLVICYGDKERILKLAEKPVIIFKELQELGKHPAIMLRQLAATKEKEEDVLYEDLRIGDDIPGGTL